MTSKKAPSPPGPLSPNVWSDAFINAFKSDVKLGGLSVRALSGKDHWGPTNEDFSEPAAWMHLLGLNVSISVNTPGTNTFWISRRGCTPWKIDACAPGELVTALKKYAEDNPVPFITNGSIDANDIKRFKNIVDKKRVKVPNYDDMIDATSYSKRAFGLDKSEWPDNGK